MQPNDQQNMQIKKRLSLNWKRLVLIIVGLALLAAAGTFAYLYWAERENTATLQTQISQQNSKKQDNTSSPQLAPAQARYSAAVGKFTLTLSEMYYIIVDLDGPFEGGPATRLAVATRNDTGEQTVFSPSHSRVTVDAYPLNGSSYATRVQAALQDVPDAQKQPGTKVDGVNAEVYQLNGLFTDKKLFFTKNDMFYEITAHSSDVTAGILDAVTQGFKFNS